ncbi:unnamed protein product [Darwinula stevensoni]|uniref:DNA2/NAM7 helicase-like C-terminal domain-containing protein n=1 Tax=Darwinula stevensoni TaxID=69355 RepID=A0A7R9A1D3_9CRUS|nr:unnamed protein product [Darwinula stevensoni]CAG0883231.1 unnamed protein product [Darwinula stevensoni]
MRDLPVGRGASDGNRDRFPVDRKRDHRQSGSRSFGARKTRPGSKGFDGAWGRRVWRSVVCLVRPRSVSLGSVSRVRRRRESARLEQAARAHTRACSGCELRVRIATGFLDDCGEGMDSSLFARLHGYRPEDTAYLGLQYRMNSAILDLANGVTYDGTLRCGDPAVAGSTISVRREVRVQFCVLCVDSALSGQPGWLQEALSPALRDSVKFLDTAGVDKGSEGRGKNRSQVECDLALRLVRALHESQVVVASLRLMLQQTKGVMV